MQPCIFTDLVVGELTPFVGFPLNASESPPKCRLIGGGFGQPQGDLKLVNFLGRHGIFTAEMRGSPPKIGQSDRKRCVLVPKR